MKIELKDKVNAFLGIINYCEKCGSVFYGEENCNKHEENCKGFAQ